MEKSLFINKKKRFFDYIIPIISGILLSLSFPNSNYSIFAWIAVVPLLLKVATVDRFRSFKMGFACGLVFYFSTLSWIVNTMVNYGNMSLPVGYAVLSLLVAYMSLFTGAFCFFVQVVSGRNILYKWFYTPLIWVILELIRSFLLSGFPWATLGYTQYKFTTLIQIVDITGIYGISYLIILVNATFCYLIEGFLNATPVSSYSSKKPQLNAKPVILTTMIVALCYFYGVLRIEENKTDVKKNFLSVRVVQGNVEQDKKWDSRYKAAVFDKYKKLTLQEVSKKKPHLIVWPETATPFYYSLDKEYTPKMYDLVDMAGAALFFGSPRYIYNDEGNLNMYNSAYLLSSSKETSGPYDKMHLVPFGEYVPLKSLLWFVDKLVEGIGEFKNGEEFTLFKVSDIDFSAIICFEIIYPDLVRRFVKKGAKFLVNITNDAWFGKSAASYQHISMVVFRAIENRVPIVRAANTGISAFISPIGVIENNTDIFIESVIQKDVYPKGDKITFYSAYGDMFVYFCAAVLAIALMVEAVLGTGKKRF